MSRSSRKFAQKLLPSIGKSKHSATIRLVSPRRLGLIDRFSGQRWLAALSLVFLISGCQTPPKVEPTVVGRAGSAEGQWRGKAMVRDLRKGKSALLTLDILAREPSQLRMEIAGSFGVHVASIALNGNEVRYILTQEKRFVTASAAADSFAKLVPVHLPPAALLAILFERPLPMSDWKCEKDPVTKLPFQCTHRGEGVSVTWVERNGRNRRLKIGAQDAEIEMVLDEAKSKVELNDGAFILTAPNGYRTERL